MEFYKEVILLKQISEREINVKPLSAIARTEIEDGVCTFFLSVINAKFNASGEYFLYYLDSSDKLFCFNLGKRPSSFTKTFESPPKLKKGACVGLFLVVDDIPELLAFGKSNEHKTDIPTLKKKVYEYVLNQREERQQALNEIYNDEAVATENYYEKEIENVLYEDVGDTLQCQEEAQEEQPCDCLLQDETNFIKGTKYIDNARQELEEIFEKFPTHEGLEKLFPLSKFAKVNFAPDKYYVVGIINENGQEKYLCYGVPGKYNEQAPKELAPYCTFIPVSIFNLSGDGFWMMFQDAVTGKCVCQKD